MRAITAHPGHQTNARESFTGTKRGAFGGNGRRVDPGAGWQVLGHVRGLARDHVAVADIQERRCVAPAMQEAVRFAAYVAPLDKEQTVATVYAGPIGELQRWLPDSDPGSGLSLAPRSADRYWVST